MRWDVISGALPAGLAIVVPVPAGRPSTTEPTYMNIEGIPTTVQMSTFTLRAVDAEGLTATRTYTIRINPARALAITPQSSNPLSVGVPSNLWYGASGGVQPYRWEVSAGAVPPGMALIDDTPGDALVRVGGTPTSSGTFTWTLRLSEPTASQSSGRSPSRSLQPVSHTHSRSTPRLCPEGLR